MLTEQSIWKITAAFNTFNLGIKPPHKKRWMSIIKASFNTMLESSKKKKSDLSQKKRQMKCFQLVSQSHQATSVSTNIKIGHSNKWGGRATSQVPLVFKLRRREKDEKEAITSDTCTFSQTLFRTVNFNGNLNMNKSI